MDAGQVGTGKALLTIVTAELKNSKFMSGWLGYGQSFIHDMYDLLQIWAQFSVHQKQKHLGTIWICIQCKGSPTSKDRLIVQ